MDRDVIMPIFWQAEKAQTSEQPCPIMMSKAVYMCLDKDCETRGKKNELTILRSCFHNVIFTAAWNTDENLGGQTVGSLWGWVYEYM